jgi:hypothetical protein
MFCTVLQPEDRIMNLHRRRFQNVSWCWSLRVALRCPTDCDSFFYDTRMNEKRNDSPITHEVLGTIRDVCVFQKVPSTVILARTES